MNIKATLLSLPIVATVATGVVLIACSDSDPPKSAELDSTAAAVSGAPDTHCGTKTVTVSEAACKATPSDEEHAGHEHGDDDGGTAMGDMDDYGPTAYNNEADDDDCKYHVKWTSGAVAQNADVSFQLVTPT